MMKVRNYIIEWDRFDEDRWILAGFTTIIILVVAYILINIIKIPQNPVKPKEIIEFEFVAPEVKKKIIEIKPREIKPQPIPEKEVVEEIPEVVLDIFMETPKSVLSLPQNLPISDQLKIFEHESDTREQAQAITRITDGILLPETDVDPLDINKGLSSEWDADNLKSTIITPNIGDRSLKENVGLSTTIRTKEQHLSTDFSGFKGEIPWEKMLDPIFDWINKNAGPIGQVPSKKLINDDMTAKTAKINIIVADTTYELILASKEEKRQLTICMVNLQTNRFVMLVDPGLTKQSSMYNTGKVQRDANKEIVHFYKSTYKAANDPEAQNFMKIFWQWARSVTGQE